MDKQVSKVCIYVSNKVLNQKIDSISSRYCQMDINNKKIKSLTLKVTDIFVYRIEQAYLSSKTLICI